MSIIQEHCTIPHYHKQHIMTAASANESNERILTFLEDTFLQPDKCDEFFVIVQKLVEVPAALPIIESMRKGKSHNYLLYTYQVVCVYVLIQWIHVLLWNVHMYTCVCMYVAISLSW